MKASTFYSSKACFSVGSINLSLVHRLILSPKIYLWEHQKFIALNSSSKMKGDELAIKYKKDLIFIASLSHFICDYKIYQTHKMRNQVF